MIEFKHYMKSALINSGTPSFREYTSSIDKKRLIQFLDGSITELIPEDFGNLISIKARMFSYLPNVERIEMSDNITNLSNNAFDDLLNIKEIIFSANIILIDDCFGRYSDSSRFNNNIILDFSKAKQIPTCNISDSEFMVNVVTIKVPSNLYDDWIISDDYKNLGISKIVAV